jgi:hypothetical protein
MKSAIRHTIRFDAVVITIALNQIDPCSQSQDSDAFVNFVLAPGWPRRRKIVRSRSAVC